MVSVTVWGEATEGGRLIRRNGASAGDLLVVTGELGGSFESGRHLRPEPRLAEGQWLAQQEAVTAMMVDGLAADAPKLAKASGCGELLPGRVPVPADLAHIPHVIDRVMGDGEDFELLFTIDPGYWPTLTLAWPFETAIHNVGWLLEQPGSFIEDPYGRMVPSPMRASNTNSN